MKSKYGIIIGLIVGILLGAASVITINPQVPTDETAIAPPKIASVLDNEEIWKSLNEMGIAERDLTARFMRDDHYITTKGEVERFLTLTTADPSYKKILSSSKSYDLGKEFALLGRLLEWSNGELVVGWAWKSNIEITESIDKLITTGEVDIVIVVKEGDQYKMYAINGVELTPFKPAKFVFVHIQ